jgi:hypothetical protein
MYLSTPFLFATLAGFVAAGPILEKGRGTCVDVEVLGLS